MKFSDIFKANSTGLAPKKVVSDGMNHGGTTNYSLHEQLLAGGDHAKHAKGLQSIARALGCTDSQVEMLA